MNLYGHLLVYSLWGKWALIPASQVGIQDLEEIERWWGLACLVFLNAQHRRDRFSSRAEKHSSLGTCSALPLEKLLSFLIDYIRKFLVHTLRCGEYKNAKTHQCQIWQVKDETKIPFWVSCSFWLGFLVLLPGFMRPGSCSATAQVTLGLEMQKITVFREARDRCISGCCSHPRQISPKSEQIFKWRDFSKNRCVSFLEQQLISCCSGVSVPTE